MCRISSSTRRVRILEFKPRGEKKLFRARTATRMVALLLLCNRSPPRGRGKGPGRLRTSHQKASGHIFPLTFLGLLPGYSPRERLLEHFPDPVEFGGLIEEEIRPGPKAFRALLGVRVVGEDDDQGSQLLRHNRLQHVKSTPLRQL